jgi:hypothetical protein
MLALNQPHSTRSLCHRTLLETHGSKLAVIGFIGGGGACAPQVQTRCCLAAQRWRDNEHHGAGTHFMLGVHPAVGRALEAPEAPRELLGARGGLQRAHLWWQRHNAHNLTRRVSIRIPRTPQTPPAFRSCGRRDCAPWRWSAGRERPAVWPEQPRFWRGRRAGAEAVATSRLPVRDRFTHARSVSDGGPAQSRARRLPRQWCSDGVDHQSAEEAAWGLETSHVFGSSGSRASGAAFRIVRHTLRAERIGHNSRARPPLTAPPLT